MIGRKVFHIDRIKANSENPDVVRAVIEGKEIDL
jgi:hypothetical protein